MKRAMRRMRKALVMVACMALVAGLAIGGTLAWLAASTTPVVNTFTVGNIDIKLEETFNTPETNPTSWTGLVMPGDNLEKDPKVTVIEGSEDCWLFVQVTESDNWPDNTKIHWSIADGWTQVPNETDVWYRKVLAEDSVKEFGVLKNNLVYVDENLTKTEVDNIIAGLTVNDVVQPFTMTVTAYAVQYLGFDAADDADVTKAWQQAKLAVYEKNDNAESDFSNKTDGYATPVAP